MYYNTQCAVGPCSDPNDSDGDGIGDRCDNCRNVSNPNQRDQDRDGWGDVCDNCIYAYNPGQENDDGDSTGNLCDADLDNDGISKYVAICITVLYIQTGLHFLLVLFL